MVSGTLSSEPVCVRACVRAFVLARACVCVGVGGGVFSLLMLLV